MTHLECARDELRSTLADIREYVNFLKNRQLKGDFLEKFDAEYVRYLKRKYFDRLEYFHYCEYSYSLN